ncbi:uncharacterized protein LOC116978408 [Amblyraja radiata]|uniref:uncharacterized protein LOC116978408 n=1 Tax=Amblyraja radiata TaxID=386614 RepID=UPI001401F197|nr:uncharacterized protein LOC116978408 [Amblyraja radiata]
MLLTGGPDHIYFSNRAAEIDLKGPERPDNSEHVLKWKPHSGQHTQKLATIKRSWGNWKLELNRPRENNGLYRDILLFHGIQYIKIRQPAFNFAGLFTLIQKQPVKQIVKQYEIFGLKVEFSPQRPVVGSDVTLSCTISRLSDTVSLHLRPMGSSQQNTSNTDQIRLDNTVYLMIRHVTVEDGKLYVCEVQEKGKIVYTTKADFSVNREIYLSSITLYRGATDHSELHLNCYLRNEHFTYAEWTWSSPLHQIQEKEIATASRYQLVHLNSTYFKNRMATTKTWFDGYDFTAKIVPVLFEDAGVYKCSMDSIRIVTFELITMKVTAEETEGDTITLTCSVSHVTASMKLVWINGNDRYVGEKTLTGDEKSVRLTIQKADEDQWDWKCGVFYLDRPQLFIPFYLEPSGSGNSIYFFHQEGKFVLKGPDSPGNGPIDWEWRPHSGQQTTKRLATFHRDDQRWAVQLSDEYNQIPGISQRMHADWGTLNLRIRKPIFEHAGLFTWTQTQPGGKILIQWELFGIKVEADSPKPVMGSDITLSCTISRLPDTVSLHWKPRGSSQQNWRNNTDQIRLNNTVYLMVQHVGAGNPNLYTCEARRNCSIVLTANTNIKVDHDLHNKMYTVYRSVTDHNKLDLICEASPDLSETKWTWRSQHFQNQEKEIASTRRSEPIHIKRNYFEDRLEIIKGNLTSKNFSVRIVPVRFEDAGVYTCSSSSYEYVTIELITVTVTAEPSDAVTEGDTVTLTCSVSHVTKSMRLVWINDDDKTVEEETFKEQHEGKSLQLIIPNANGARRKWKCIVFHQNTPKTLIPYYLQVKKKSTFNHYPVVITGIVALLLIIVLVVVLCLKKCKLTGLANQRQKPPQSNRNIEDEFHLYSNTNEIHQTQGSNKTLIPETSHKAEYMAVNRKSKKEGVMKTPYPETDDFAEYSNVNRKPTQDTEEDIHYGSISFKLKASDGRRHGTQPPNQPSNNNPVSSDEDGSSVIYAQMAQTKI